MALLPPPPDGDNGSNGGRNTDPAPLTNTSSLTDEQSRSGDFITATSTVNGGEEIDTFIWTGGRLGSGGANNLDLGQLENFEIYRLMPADNSALMLSAANCCMFLTTRLDCAITKKTLKYSTDYEQAGR